MTLNNNNSNIGSEILYEVMFGKGKCFFPGGFKPPHVGHYEALKDLVSRSYITEVEVIISSKPREGITAEESKAVWDIFLKAQPLQKVKVVISPDPSPVITIYHYLEAYPQEVPVYLAGGEDDKGYFDSLQKRFGDQVLTISIDDKVGRISGTYVREVIRSGDFDHFKECLPPAVVNKGYADDIFAIVSKTASQEKSQLNELADTNTLPYDTTKLHPDRWEEKSQFTTTKGTRYSVNISQVQSQESPENNTYEVDFGQSDMWFSKRLTNKYEISEVMATVTDIIKTFIEKYKPKKIIWTGLSKQKEKTDSSEFNTQRNNLYNYYLQKNINTIPDYSHYISGPYMFVVKKDQLNEGIVIQVQTKPLSSEVNLPDFFSYVCRMLEIEKAPELILLDKPIMGETDGQPSFASYEPGTGIIRLYKEKRHIVDSMRSLAHEMCHHRQNELNQLSSDTDGVTGSEIENEANSVAGMLVRKYGKDNPQIYF